MAVRLQHRGAANHGRSPPVRRLLLSRRRSSGVDRDDAIRPQNRQRSQQNGLGEAEHRRSGAVADGERADRQGGEAVNDDQILPPADLVTFPAYAFRRGTDSQLMQALGLEPPSHAENLIAFNLWKT